MLRPFLFKNAKTTNTTASATILKAHKVYRYVCDEQTNWR